MALVVGPLIRRRLQGVEAFVDARTLPLPFSFNTDEVVVGWYRNPAPWEQCYVVFTEVAIYEGTERSWNRIPLDDLTRFEMPESKTESTGVRVRTREGIAFIRFAGRSGPDGRYSDAFALVGLLRVVVLVNHRARQT